MQDNETDNKNISSDYSDIIEEGYQENKYEIDQYIQNLDPNEPKNNLIVNYLPSGMTETQLKDLFQEYGQLESVKLMTDKNTKMSLGYGFVKFAHDEDAKKALESLNGKTLENKTLKVNIAKQNGKIKKSNLYIAYLSNQISDKFILRSQFEKFGKIMDTKLLSDERGNNKGVGFVRFENKEDAERAIQAMNGCMDPQICNGLHPLVVKFSDKDKRDKTKMQNKNPFRPPFLKNYAMFTGYRYSPYGGAYDRVPNPYPPPYPYPPETYMPPSFVGYPNPTPYPNPIPPINNVMPKNFLPVVPNSPEGVYCLFVYNLPSETDDTLLYRLFNPYGNISSVKVIKEPTTGQCKGYSFVNFYKYEEAYAAVNALNGFIYQNKKLQVSFKKSN